MEDQKKRFLNSFGAFFNHIGFKRIDGHIYALLVLSENELTQDEIEKELGLSQSSISLSLKNLAHFGAIEIDSARPRIKTYRAKEDSLSVVSSLFKKREQDFISEFKRANVEMMAQLNKKDTKVKARIQSIIETCTMAESVIDFVINLTSTYNQNLYQYVVKKLPTTLDTLVKSRDTVAQATQGATLVAGGIASKLKEGIISWAQDLEEKS